MKTAPSSLFIFQRPNDQCGVLLISAGVIEGHLEGKSLRREVINWGSCACMTMTRLNGHLQAGRN
jgi:hypothetical protein